MILIQFNFIEIKQNIFINYNKYFYFILFFPSFLVMSKLKLIWNILTHAIICD